MSVTHPEILLLALVLIAGFAWLYRSFSRRREAAALTYSNLAFALEAMRPARWPAAALFAAFAIGTGALLTALAGPHFDAKVPTKDGIVMICIDTSGSMRSQDVAPTRAEAAIAAAHTFVDAVPAGTKIGIVSFSSGANLIQPPSDDLDAVRQALDRVPPPDGATAIGDALTLAAQQMRGNGKRVIVLLTDGVNNRGSDPVEASRKIGALGITIETVGVGTNGSGDVIPGTNELADLDEGALRAVAANGGGQYVEAGDADSLRAAFANIALSTVWEKKHVDGSFAFAFVGGVLLLGALLGGMGAGRFP
jgi:Ca-activated chloride channel family protein